MILIVEDEQINCFLLNSFLEKKSYQTVIAYNGKEALEQLDKNMIEYILLDLNMPIMNGYEFLMEMTTNPKYKYNNYKVIIISTIEMAHFLQEVKNQNINIDKVIGYLPKPVDFNNLQKLLQNNVRSS